MGGEIEEWYQNKLSKVQSDVESLHSYIEGESRRTGMKEEVEQIDELSKKTLGSYVNKAMDSARELPGTGTNAEASKKTKRYAAVSAAAYRTQGLAPRKGTDMFKKYKAESVVAEGSDDKEPFDYEKWKASTVKPRKPRGYKAAEALGKAIDSEQSELRKRKKQGVAEGFNEIDDATNVVAIKKLSNSELMRYHQDFKRSASMTGDKQHHYALQHLANEIKSRKQGVAEAVGQTSNSNENPDAGRFTSGPAKKPMKPAPIITAEQTATDLGKERYEVPFEGPYAKNTTKVTTDKSGAKHTAMSRVKHLAKTAARKQAGLKEEQEPEDSFEKTSTPAKRSLSKTAGIVKDLAKNSKSSSKEKADTFQAEPELSSQIIKT
jgi:hypothetical protein